MQTKHNCKTSPIYKRSKHRIIEQNSDYLKMVDYRIWYRHGEYITIGDHKIFVKDNGQIGKPVIFLMHGFPTSCYDWYKIWPTLHKSFHLIAFDFLGFGYSDKPYPYTYTIEEQADIADQILILKKVSSCYVMAHDYAVSVTQELIHRRLSNNQLPQFTKIILLNGGLFPETHMARPIQKMLLGRWGKFVNMLLSKKSLKKNLIEVFGPNTAPSDQEIDAFWDIICHNNGKRCFHQTIHYMNDRIRNRDAWVNALINTSIPIRLVNGPEDPVSGRHLVERYKELVPNPDCVFLDNIGHYPNVEAPQEIIWQVNQYFV